MLEIGQGWCCHCHGIFRCVQFFEGGFGGDFRGFDRPHALNGLGIGRRLFTGQSFGLIIGIGPTNEGGIFLITGTYGAHNEFLETVLRMGVLGLVVLVWLLCMIGRRYQFFRNSGNATMHVLGSAMLAVLAANVMCAVTQAHLLHSYATYILGIFIYWLYGTTLGGCPKAYRIA